jgi:hypothetical protein
LGISGRKRYDECDREAAEADNVTECDPRRRGRAPGLPAMQDSPAAAVGG